MRYVRYPLKADIRLTATFHPLQTLARRCDVVRSLGQGASVMLRAFGLSLLLATSNATAIAAPDPQSITLDQLRNAPRQFAGHAVRLRGQVDQCWNMGCLLCPLDAT